jgi:hypothetical protein
MIIHMLRNLAILVKAPALRNYCKELKTAAGGGLASKGLRPDDSGSPWILRDHTAEAASGIL